MYAAYLPSGDVTELGGAACALPASARAHVYAARSHVQRARSATSVASPTFPEKRSSWTASAVGSTRPPVAVASAVASRAWSNAAARLPRAGSTSTYSAPDCVVVRYQNRPSSSQVGGVAVPATSGNVLAGR